MILKCVLEAWGLNLIYLSQDIAHLSVMKFWANNVRYFRPANFHVQNQIIVLCYQLHEWSISHKASLLACLRN